MNQKVLIGAVGAVVIFLALPVVLNVAGITAAPPQAPVARPAAAPSPPPMAVNRPAALQPPPGGGFAPPALPAAPQLPPAAHFAPPAMPAAPPPGQLNAASLVGTVWLVNTPYGPVQVQLNPGGQLTGNHSLIGAIPGTWSLHGNRLTVRASAMGQSIAIDAAIQGNMIVVQGQPLTRLR